MNQLHDAAKRLVDRTPLLKRLPKGQTLQQFEMMCIFCYCPTVFLIHSRGFHSLFIFSNKLESQSSDNEQQSQPQGGEGKLLVARFEMI